MRTRIPHLPHLIRSAAPTAELVPDRALIAEFVTAKCGMAFELLVRRHGPAVWAVCRRHLANEHDVEDAFQATFLVLAKSATRISKHASVGSWLYGVAYRVALKARRTTARRKRVEAVVSPTDEPVTLPVPAFNDTTALVHAELEKLPDRYRLPLLLCDLEGLSRKEASAQLGWSEGTLSGRLNRARKLLAGRLTVRGVAAAVLVGTATVPPAQAMTAAAVGVGLNVIGTSTTAAPETVTALAHGAMRDMTRSFVLKAAGVALAASVLLGGGLFGLRFDTAPHATAAPVPKVEMAKAEGITEAHVELLSQPAIQRELNLSAELRVRFIDGLDKLDEGLGWWRGVPIPDADTDPDRLKYVKDCRELAASVLTKAQLGRLHQCEVQLLGAQALRLKRVQDELGLTVEQKKAVPAGVFDVRNAELPRVDDDRRPSADPLTDLLGGLTDRQRTKWKELNGEKVEFNEERVSKQCQTVFRQFPSAPSDERLSLPPGQGGGQLLPQQPTAAPQLPRVGEPVVVPPPLPLPQAPPPANIGR